MKPNSILALILCAAMSVSSLYAQNTSTTAPATPAAAVAAPAPVVDHSYKPLTLKLNEDGSKYVRFITWLQFWGTATQNNPGTKDLNGKLIDGMEGINPDERVEKFWSERIERLL